jgi:ketosteroid isomerase-like protein
MPADDRSSVEQALATFLDAFNRLEWERFRACFAPEATTFHPSGALHRLTGDAFDQAWQRVFADIRSRSGQSTPPYQDLQPRDLAVQPAGDVAVVTFHLQGPGRLGRRTLVLRRSTDGWHIIHLHASNRPLEAQ